LISFAQKELPLFERAIAMINQLHLNWILLDEKRQSSFFEVKRAGTDFF